MELFRGWTFISLFLSEESSSYPCKLRLCIFFVMCFSSALEKKKALLENCKMSQMSAQMIPFHCKIHGSWLSSQLHAYPVKLQTVLVSSVQSGSASAEKEESEWSKSGSAGSSPSSSTPSASWPIEVGQVPPLQSQGLSLLSMKEQVPNPHFSGTGNKNAP